MLTAPDKNRDLLGWIINNRWMRLLLAIAILIRCIDTFYETGKDAIVGFRQGWTDAAKRNP